MTQINTPSVEYFIMTMNNDNNKQGRKDES